MSVQIEAIKFNHRLNSATHDAFNIRRNATQQVPNPEWQRGISVNPEDSLAAYAIEETRGNTLTIQVKFRPARVPIRVPLRVKRIEVRTVDPFLWYSERFPPALRNFIERMRGKVSLNVLGQVSPQEVTFDKQFETFELRKGFLPKAGVGIYDVAWLWQYRLSPSDSWSDITLSKHRIYTVLEIPKSPWVQTPHDDPSVPWAEVLNYACSWARGAKNLDEAAGLVTRRIYDLGPEVMEYDCTGGSPAYSFFWLNDTPIPDLFDCTAFLELLNGGIGWGPYVNCSDCATFVSTFANILGCNLSQSKMFSADAPKAFGCNPILAIGTSDWKSPCDWCSFAFHEVAWKGSCTSSDNIFDACLAVDGDADPSTPPHEFLLPVNMPFEEYRYKLARNGDCVAHSNYCQRRNIV